MSASQNAANELIHRYIFTNWIKSMRFSNKIKGFSCIITTHRITNCYAQSVTTVTVTHSSKNGVPKLEQFFEKTLVREF